MVTVTQAAMANKTFREFNKCRTLLQTLEKKREFLKDKIQVHHINRFNDVTIDLKIHRSRLDNKQFIYNTPKWLDWPVKDVVNYVFQDINRDNSANYTTLEQETVNLMHELDRQAKVSLQRFLLQSEIAHKAHLGWYFIFNTLTVRDGSLHEVFNPKSRAFIDYIRNFDNAVRIAITGNTRTKIDQPYHTYFAVTERGGKTGRLHIHCLHAVSTLPLGTRCPNFGEATPTKRELANLKSYWRYGFSVPIAVRYSASDAYGLSGYRWPLDTKTGKGLKSNSPLAIAGYMSKYVLKAYQQNQRTEYKWRIKKRPKLGHAIPAELISMLNPTTIHTMIHTEAITANLNNQTVPRYLLKILALHQNQNTLGSIKQFELLKDTPSQPGLLTQVRALTEPSQKYSPSKTSPSLAQNISAEDISDAQNDVNNASQYIDQKYYGRTTYERKSNSTRGI